MPRTEERIVSHGNCFLVSHCPDSVLFHLPIHVDMEKMNKDVIIITCFITTTKMLTEVTQRRVYFDSQ